MDKRKVLLLAYLSKNCDNNYKVLDTNKVIKDLKKYKGNYQRLQEDIEFLKKLKFIDLKYFDETNICLCILDNSNILSENLRTQKKNSYRSTAFLVICGIVCSICSFGGAFLAILLFR